MTRIAGVFLVALGAGIAFAQNPFGPGFLYQGRLLQAGQPVNGAVSVTARLFDSPLDGALLGVHALADIQVTDGRMAAFLNEGGQFGPLAFNGDRRWIEFTIDGNLLSPRQEITPAPYAAFSAFSGGPWQTSAVDISYMTGNVGIGTAAPQQKLDVKGWVRCEAIQITGGADLAEPFDVREGDETRPGMVVCIDPAEIGKLRLATRAYDRTVAGVVSGANGVQPGMVLQQMGKREADGKHPVALSGRVWVYADASAGGAITAGDLLTTSDTPGHAMKVTDHSRANGAILGKAMSSLASGQGLVLVLVGLQ